MKCSYCNKELEKKEYMNMDEEPLCVDCYNDELENYDIKDTINDTWYSDDGGM